MVQTAKISPQLQALGFGKKNDFTCLSGCLLILNNRNEFDNNNNNKIQWSISCVKDSFLTLKKGNGRSALEFLQDNRCAERRSEILWSVM